MSENQTTACLTTACPWWKLEVQCCKDMIANLMIDVNRRLEDLAKDCEQIGLYQHAANIRKGLLPPCECGDTTIDDCASRPTRHCGLWEIENG